MDIYQTILFLLLFLILTFIWNKRGFLLFGSDTIIEGPSHKRLSLNPRIVFFVLGFFYLTLRIVKSFSMPLFWDETEHLHVAWLMSQGLVPFQDFFEHHPPFFWWIISFIPKMQPDISIASYYHAAKTLIVIINFSIFLFVYKISCTAYKSQTAGYISAIILILSGWQTDNLFEIRPDGLMISVFLLSSLCFILYLKKQKDILLYYGLFFLIFSQFILPKLSLVCLFSFCYITYETTKKFGIIKSGFKILFPSILSIFILLLFYSLMTSPIDLFNFTIRVNGVMTTYLLNRFQLMHSQQYLPILVLCGGGIIGSLLYINKGFRNGIVFLSFLLIASLLEILYLIPHLISQYYLTFYIILAILCGGIILFKGINHNILNVSFVILVFIFPIIIPNYHENLINKKIQIEEMSYILKNTSQNERILIAPQLHPIFRFDASYYWFSRWRMVPDLINNLEKLDFLPYKDELKDVTVAFDKNKPKFITSPNSFTWNTVDKNLILKYYKKNIATIPFTYPTILYPPSVNEIGIARLEN
jgi:hypothetical protein